MAQGTEQLVGRAAELESLDRALTELERRRPVALALMGDPGIGKTRLLSELAARADARGWLVLTGSASELEYELPFWVFVDALDEYVHGLEPRRLDSMDEDARAELAHLLPSVTDGTPLPPERYRTHRAMRQLLEALARSKPMVLALDDLHWADPGSIELIASLLLRPPAAVLIALAVRGRQVPERLQGPLERARQAGALTELELGALSADQARRLLGAAVSDELYEESGGNPFYLQQLARFPDARSVAAALTEELRPLPEPTRRVLNGAAVAGDPFELDLAAAAADVPEPAALEALDELLRLDLVRATDVPRRFRFRHPLVRSAVYETAPAAWRLGAHERAAEALAALGAFPLERAHHVERSARKGDTEAVAVLRAAGEATALRAPAIAAAWFAAALRILPAGGDRIELLTALSNANASIGRFEEAHAATLEALECAPSDIALIAAAAGLERVLGDHDRANARLTAAIEAIPDRRSPAGVAVMLELASGAVFRGAFVPMRDWATQALSAAKSLGDRPATLASAALVALANGFLGAVAEAEEACAEASGLLAAMSDDEFTGSLDATVNLAAAEYYLDRLVEASAHAEHAYEVGRAAGHGDLFFAAYGIVGNIRLARGDLPGAARFFDAAVETTRLSGYAQLIAWNLVNRSLVAVVAGDAETALAAIEESGTGRLYGVASAWSRVARAAAQLEAGDAVGAEQALVRSAGGDELRDVPGSLRAWGLDVLTRCRLQLGRLDEAARAAAAARAFADATGLPLAAARAELAAAAVALDAGDPATAADRALSAASRADGAGAVIDAARSRAFAGRALAQAGEAERAAAELERAAAAFEACGALRRRDEAERELGKLGRRRHRRTRRGMTDTGIDSLTERELQVARLIVDRKTNPQIAAELFLSQKTVESHVRNLFHKLDVNSRVDVARLVERANR